MHAGTLLRVEPADEPLASTYADGTRLPGIDVQETQETVDGTPIQAGVAAGTVRTERPVPTTYVDADQEGHEPAGITTEREPVSEPHHTEWVADVTDTGLLAIASLAGGDELAFPLDLFAAHAGDVPVRLGVDVEALAREWSDTDDLTDTWLSAHSDEDTGRIAYDDAAAAGEATTGLGFTRAWDGSVVRGVVYDSGYLALYNCSRPVSFVQFVADELGPYLYEPDSGGGEQQTLGGDGA